MLREHQASDKLKVGNLSAQPKHDHGPRLLPRYRSLPASRKLSSRRSKACAWKRSLRRSSTPGLAESTEAFLAVASNAEPFKETHARLADIPEGQGLEGYLFPSTYRIEATATITDVIEKMLTDGFDVSLRRL